MLNFRRLVKKSRQGDSTMKKLTTVVLLCVMVASFAFGALAGTAQAKPGTVPDHCVRSMAYSYCDLDTCKMYDPWICNGKLRYIWNGDYCC
jgi:hypothetical protein